MFYLKKKMSPNFIEKEIVLKFAHTKKNNNLTTQLSTVDISQI